MEEKIFIILHRNWDAPRLTAADPKGRLHHLGLYGPGNSVHRGLKVMGRLFFLILDNDISASRLAES